MVWCLAIGPLDNSLILADVITELMENHDWDYDEYPNSIRRNPSYTLVTGRFSDKQDAEHICEELRVKYGWRITVIQPGDHETSSDDITVTENGFVEDLLNQYSQGVSIPAISVLIEQEKAAHPRRSLAISKAVFAQFKDVDHILSIPHGVDYVREVRDFRFLKVLINRMMRHRMVDEAIELLKQQLALEDDVDVLELLTSLLFEHRVNLIVKDSQVTVEECVDSLRDFVGNPNLPEEIIHKMLFKGLTRYPELSHIQFEISDRYEGEWRSDPDIVREIAVNEYRKGNITSAIEMLEPLADEKKWERQLQQINSHKNLLDNGWILPPKALPSHAIRRRSVQYLAYTSVPHHTSGYATRTHNVLRSLSGGVWTVEGVTRYGYPWIDLKSKIKDEPMTSEVDGVTYHRQFHDDKYLTLVIEQRLDEAVNALVAHCEENGVPEIIHAASNWTNGIVAVHAGRILGIPVVYEIRGLWELTRAAKDPQFEGTDHFNMIARMEVEAAKGAEHVITITEGLRDILIERGVPAEKISIAPNGVDADRFKPLQRDQELAQELSIEEEPVVGYVGSLVHYEGLDLLLRAVAQLRESDLWRGKVLIVGEGEARPELEKLARDLRIDDICCFTGGVDFRDVSRYYSLIDIAPFPRLALKVCELVSPLKPFEAMAMGKAVISSDVSALKEFIIDGENGLLFQKGDIDSLAEVLHRAISDDELRGDLSVRSRRWVMENRTWKQCADAIESCYEAIRHEQRPTVLIAGHDLKFIYEMGREFIRRGINVLEDKWENHTRHDEGHSRRMLRSADFVICEWALGNAKWYAENKRADQKLLIRFHRQELETDHIDGIDWGAVDEMVFIAPHVMRQAIERFNIPPQKAVLISNYVDTQRFERPKREASKHTLGIIGIVPKMKRFDRAIEILEGVRSKRPEFRLSVKGKRPEEYPWMHERKEEMEWYQKQEQRIEASPLLCNAIDYEGWTPNPHSWFEKIGFILSVSDFEGSHQVIAEGAASGAIPIIVKWEGANEVYPREWCVNTVEQAIERILEISENLTFDKLELERMKLSNHIKDEFDLRHITDRWLELMGINRSAEIKAIRAER